MAKFGFKSAAKKSSSPAPAHRAPPPPVQGSDSDTFADVILRGISFGTGNAFGHRAVDAVVDAVVGPRVVRYETSAAAAAGDAHAPAPAAAAPSLPQQICVKQYQAFEECLSSNVENISKCQLHIDMLRECGRNASVTA